MGGLSKIIKCPVVSTTTTARCPAIRSLPRQLTRHVGVPQRRVAEDFLDDADIDPLLQQERRSRVPRVVQSRAASLA
jgi:hypothetical protein